MFRQSYPWTRCLQLDPTFGQEALSQNTSFPYATVRGHTTYCIYRDGKSTLPSPLSNQSNYPSTVVRSTPYQHYKKAFFLTLIWILHLPMSSCS